MHRFLSVLLLLFFLSVSLAYSFSITGTVTDEDSERLPDVMVILPELDLIAYTDADGRFYFGDLETGDYTLIIDAEGYLGKELLFTLNGDKEFEIILRSDLVYMDPIDVTAGKNEPDESPAQTTYSREEMENTPLYSDPFNIVDRESDIISFDVLNASSNSIYYANLPSDSITSRGFVNVVSVDGSDPDWNNYYLDLFQLPYLRHYTGGKCRSVLPLDMFESVKTYKGTSPFEYGPGIGGTFIAQPFDTVPDDSLVKLDVSTEYIDFYTRWAITEDMGLYASVRHSIFQFTTNYGGVKDKNTYYYPPITADILSTIPEQNGDFLIRFIYTPPLSNIELTALGFYDISNWVIGKSVEFNDDGNITGITEGGLENIHSLSTYAGLLGARWTYSADDFFMNSLCASGSLFSINNNDTAWDDTESAFIPYRFTEITNLSFLITDEAALAFTDDFTLLFGARLFYSYLDASFRTWKVWNYIETCHYNDLDEPLFDYEYSEETGLINNFLANYEVDSHIIYDETGLPVFATGDLIPYGEDYLFAENFSHFYPSAYSRFELELDPFALSGGLGYHLYIDENEAAGYPSAALEGRYRIAEDLGTGLLLGISPGRYSEVSLAGRRMNELYYDLEAETSFINPPYALTVQPYLEYGDSDSFTVSVEPYFNWYFNLSGFSLQTNYKDTADFTDYSYTFMEPRQGLSFGCRLSNVLELNEWLYNRISYNLSWSLYDTAEYGWVYANTDIRHVIKDTFYCKPGWGLTIGATLGVYIGTAFTPYTLVSVNPESTEAGLINSARDYVPKWALNLQLRKEFEIEDFDFTVFVNSRDILRFIPQYLEGFSVYADVGDSTADYEKRFYDSESDFNSLFEIVEFGLSVKYSF